MIDHDARDMISVWMGTTTQVDAFDRYTEGMEVQGSGCPAHRDFGCGFIDSDFFVAYVTAGAQVIPVEELVREVGTYSLETNRKIVARCHELGIAAGNALYFYDRCAFIEEQPGRLYNELRFIGSFDNSRPRRRVR
ncbi:immunity 22 family protein [Lysobacter enzymogenes]|uniref:immunity 22 family protein n=1 Tax=Lysobacter enzymogenes TaxID=69 RepID=UPI001A9743F2|nr:immunity 22 family protein [Lysobacter enzymogenes]QQP95613.1 immunity 22 family protein [Lysobacter enzymogenes]